MWWLRGRFLFIFTFILKIIEELAVEFGLRTRRGVILKLKFEMVFDFIEFEALRL